MLLAETLKRHRKFENAVTMYHFLKIFINFSQLTGRLVNYLFQRKINGYLQQQHNPLWNKQRILDYFACLSKIKAPFLTTGSLYLYFVVYTFLSYFLSVISVCYISIYVKVRRSRHPQHHVADGLKERRLTSTLFLFILGSLLTFLPKVACLGVSNFPELIFRLSFPLIIWYWFGNNDICDNQLANESYSLRHTVGCQSLEPVYCK